MKILYDLSYVQENIYSSVYAHSKARFIELMKSDAKNDITLMVLRNTKLEDSILKIATNICYINSCELLHSNL